MPTGYTAGVQDGTITDFKKFALQCARVFGACVEQRDEPADVLPKERTPDPYHKEGYEEALKKIEKLSNMTDEELLEEEQLNIEKEEKCVLNIMKEKYIAYDRYMDMLKSVREWNPPTPEHENLKEYMIAQLQDSIDFDCNSDYYNSELEDILNRTNNPRSADEIRKEKLYWLKKDLKYHEEKYEKAVQNCEANNKWIRELYQSLENGSKS